MRIEEFIHFLAAEVAKYVATSPPKMFEVSRVAPTGEASKQQISVPQGLAELADTMKIVIAQQQILIQQNAAALKQQEQQNTVETALLGEFESVRKALKRRRRRAEGEDEEGGD